MGTGKCSPGSTRSSQARTMSHNHPELVTLAYEVLRIGRQGMLNTFHSKSTSLVREPKKRQSQSSFSRFSSAVVQATGGRASAGRWRCESTAWQYSHAISTGLRLQGDCHVHHCVQLLNEHGLLAISLRRYEWVPVLQPHVVATTKRHSTQRVTP